MSVTPPLTGKLIVLEGLDGCGSTTQAEGLVRWLQGRGLRAHYSREPTTGPIGAVLRMHLQKRVVAVPWRGGPEPLSEETVALAFAADRMDHVHNEIEPFLRDGIVVVLDRYYLSSLAYQSLTSDYAWIKALNARATRPDLTVFLGVRPEVCKARMERARHQVDLYEELGHLREVEASYARAVADLRADGETIHVVDGERSIDEVHAEVARLVQELIG